MFHLESLLLQCFFVKVFFDFSTAIPKIFPEKWQNFYLPSPHMIYPSVSLIPLYFDQLYYSIIKVDILNREYELKTSEVSKVLNSIYSWIIVSTFLGFLSLIIFFFQACPCHHTVRREQIISREGISHLSYLKLMRFKYNIPRWNWEKDYVVLQKMRVSYWRGNTICFIVRATWSRPH